MMRLAVIAAILLALPVTAAAEPPLHVLLTYNGRSIDTSVRQEIELQLISEFTAYGCFESIALYDEETPPGDEAITLTVRLVEIFEETTYDTSVAARADPQRPREYDLMHTAQLRLRARAQLGIGPEKETFRERNIKGVASHRPTVAGEDARAMALTAATEAIAREARFFACKGGEKRLQKELRSMRDEAR